MFVGDVLVRVRLELFAASSKDVATHAEDAFDRDPDHPVGRGAGGLQDSGHDILFLVVGPRFARSVGGMKRAAGGEARSACGVASKHGFTALGVEDAAARLQYEAPAALVELLKHRVCGAHDAEALIAVAGAVGDRQRHPRVPSNRLVSGPRDVPGGGLEVKHRVEHQLELAPPRSQHGVEAHRASGEGRIRLRLDAEDREDEAGGQGSRGHRDRGGDCVLSKTPADDEEDRAKEAHAAASVAARLSSPNSRTEENCPRTSWS